MPNQPEQGTFDLGDKQRPNPSSDPDTYPGVIRTIPGGRHGVRPNPTPELLKGAVELPEEPAPKEIPPYTHTLAPHKRIWYVDENPGGARTPSWTTQTLHLYATGDTILVQGARGRKKCFITTEDSESYREGSPPFFFPSGARVATSDAHAKKPIGMQQPPSTRLEQR